MYSFAYGTYGALWDTNSSAVQGSFYVGPATSNKHGNGQGGGGRWLGFNASRSSSVYGASSTIHPTSRQVTFLIRY